MILFRLGKNLLLGEEHSIDGDCVTVNVQARLGEDGPQPILPCLAEIHSCFVVNPEYKADVPPLDETVASTFGGIVHEAVIPFVTSGRAYAMERSSLVAYQRNDRGIGFLAESDQGVAWVGLHKILTHREFGTSMAFEALKPRVADMGLWDLTEKRRMAEVTMILRKPLHVYMKTDPFRDITKIHEGTALGIVGYEKGCLVIEADGEEFWLPVEERNEYQPSMKDDWYYFGNQDSDADLIHDPLQMLPSKPALAQTYPASPEDNWNITPDLRKTAGHFSSMPNIKMKEHADVLRGEEGLVEFLGTQGYEEFERLHREKLHDLAVKPGLKPEQEDEEPGEKHADDIRSMTTKDLARTGDDAVPHDYTGEYGDESGEVDDGTHAHPSVPPDEMNRPATEVTMDEVMDHVLEGADLDTILDASTPDTYGEAYREEFQKVFPDTDLPSA